MRRRVASLVARVSLPLLSRLDPERAHDVGLAALRISKPLWAVPIVPAHLHVRVLGLDFEHPLGLAAGFDKNGDCLDALGAIGFSHVELGTVTPRPQPGNPKPRMFRHRSSGALVNRMGFNNKGVDHLSERLAASGYTGIRGVSIGKNADTPLESAESDYLACFRKVYAQADYVAVNVSSPNTARLRELQGADGLKRIIGALLDERTTLERAHSKRVPMLVKVSPDLDGDQIASFAATVREMGVDGVIATNTSVDLRSLGPAWSEHPSGGMSGAPLHALSMSVIRALRAELGAHFPIIGVGGIVGVSQALATLEAGADLIQVYTGFAYRGVRLIEDILAALRHTGDGRHR